MKKAFNTSVDEEILEQFRNKCKEDGLTASIVLEKMMQLYLDGEYEFVIRKKDGK